MSKQTRLSFEDPVIRLLRGIRKLHSLWLAWTYPFASIGTKVSVHYTCDLPRRISGYIKLGSFILLERNVRLDVVLDPSGVEPVILIEDGCTLAQRVTLLAINRIHVQKNVIFGPSVLVTDHGHAFEDINTPIRDQGANLGGTVRIEEDCWIGFGAAIVGSREELVIGKHSVVAANSFVTRSVPPYSVVAGNPARIVKQYDPSKGKWVLGAVKSAEQQRSE